MLELNGVLVPCAFLHCNSPKLTSRFKQALRYLQSSGLLINVVVFSQVTQEDEQRANILERVPWPIRLLVLG